MKNRKKFIFYAGFALLLFLSYFAWKNQMHGVKEQEVLIECFKASRADIEESVLSGWVSLDMVLTEEDLNKKIDYVINGLNIDKSKVKKNIETGGDSNKGMFTVGKESGNYTMILESMKNDDSIESYCMFQYSFISNFENMMKEKKLIEKLLKEIDLPVKLDAMITGSYKGRLTQKQINTIISKLLKSIDAVKIESIERDDMTSVSAYSDEIGEFITSNGRKINIQFALRYSNYNNKTYIWLGCPIIPFEY